VLANGTPVRLPERRQIKWLRLEAAAARIADICGHPLWLLVTVQGFGQSMKLRFAQPSDAPSLAAISIEVWLGTYVRRGVSSFFAEYALNEFTVEKFENLIERANETFIVSENEEGPDGFIRLTSGSQAPVAGCSSYEISTLYVQPRHHGRGIGRALLEAGLSHAHDADNRSVWLATNSENTPAIGFYLSRGFIKAGTTHFRIQDQAYLNDVYRYTFK
jgi:ribosomal protein S18 acetylase RimI-like enzyme